MRLNGLPTLSKRRSLCKLKNIIKILDNQTPAYLRDILSNRIRDIRPTSRNADNFYVVKSRTENFKTSLIPSATKIWNNLSLDNRTSEYVTRQFKTQPKLLYYEGLRQNNIKHAQL